MADKDEPFMLVPTHLIDRLRRDVDVVAEHQMCEGELPNQQQYQELSNVWDSAYDVVYLPAEKPEDPRPCKGENVNVCVGEGCYDEACLNVERPLGHEYVGNVCSGFGGTTECEWYDFNTRERCGKSPGAHEYNPFSPASEIVDAQLKHISIVPEEDTFSPECRIDVQDEPPAMPEGDDPRGGDPIPSLYSGRVRRCKAKAPAKGRGARCGCDAGHPGDHISRGGYIWSDDEQPYGPDHPAWGSCVVVVNDVQRAEMVDLQRQVGRVKSLVRTWDICGVDEQSDTHIRMCPSCNAVELLRIALEIEKPS